MSRPSGTRCARAANVTAAPADMGEDFDFNDPQEMHRHLPRLAALCLGDSFA